MLNYLQETNLLDFSHEAIDKLFRDQGWSNQGSSETARLIYEFVRDEVRFGYSAFEPMKASEILKAGYGQCNTKGILLMALLRRAGIMCRFHVFGIDKSLQKGAHYPFVYQRLAQVLQHSWVEALVDDQWITLEGCILDNGWLASVQDRFCNHVGQFNGFAIAVECVHNLNVQWTGGDTWIQRAAIVEDWGLFESPDEYYATHPSNLQGWRGAAWRTLYQQKTELLVADIRAGKFNNDVEQCLSPLPGNSLFHESLPVTL